MLSSNEFLQLLDREGVLLLDGGLATELEARGHDLSHPLWSGKILKDDPQAIKDVHVEYYSAGANIAITASYQASSRGLIEHLNMSEADAKHTIRSSVDLAKQAREEVLRRYPREHALLVAGSVGPYGAYLADGSEYRGDYMISPEELKLFHRPRIEALLEAEVDLLAVETIPSLNEIKAIVELLREEFPKATAWISCTLKDSRHLADGTSIEDVVSVIQAARPQIVAFGVNCLPPELIVDFVTATRCFIDIPLVCYPNSGEDYDAVSKTWRFGSSRTNPLATMVGPWRTCGASVVGGCCRTTPSDIKDMARALRGQTDG